MWGSLISGSGVGSGITRDSHRRADIQGLRAIAVLAVVVFHAQLPLKGGFLGVDIFFVISGFVIGSMLLRQLASTGRVSFRDFYLRRFLRLTPALALVVTVTVLVSLFVLSPLGAQQVAAKTGLGAMLLSANFVIQSTTGGYFDFEAYANPLLNTWSLSVEEQFYLFFPAILVGAGVLARKGGRLKSTMWVAIGGVTVLSLTTALFVQPTQWPHPWSLLVGFYGPWSRAWEFGAGALLALLIRAARPCSAKVSLLAGWVGALCLIGSFLLISDAAVIPGPALLTPVVGTLLVIWSGPVGGASVSRLLSLAPIVKLGDWSYSWYLWHWPLIVFTTLILPGRPIVLALVAAGSLLPAVLSYRWVEQPIRIRKFKSTGRALRLVCLIVLAPSALAWGLLVASNHGLWNSDVQKYQSESEPHAGWKCLSTGTMTGNSEAMFTFGVCTWNSDAQGRPIYLIGDSHAGALSEAVIGAGQILGRPVVVDNASQCPVMDVYLRPADSEFGAAGQLCRERLELLLQALGTAPKGTVVLANSDVYWWDASTAVGGSETSQVVDPRAKVPGLRRGLSNIVRELIDAGQEVLLVQPIHRFDMPPLSWAPSDCTGIEVIAGACVGSAPVEVVDELQRDPRSAVGAVGDLFDIGVVDLRGDLCRAGVCRTSEAEFQLFMDAAHISVAESRSLVPLMAKAISGLDDTQASHPRG